MFFFFNYKNSLIRKNNIVFYVNFDIRVSIILLYYQIHYNKMKSKKNQLHLYYYIKLILILLKLILKLILK